jgi:hypothetical protein
VVRLRVVFRNLILVMHLPRVVVRVMVRVVPVRVVLRVRALVVVECLLVLALGRIPVMSASNVWIAVCSVE